LRISSREHSVSRSSSWAWVNSAQPGSASPATASSNNRQDRSNAPVSACPDPVCCAYPDTGLLLICHVLVLDTPNVAGRSPSSDQDTRKTAGPAHLLLAPKEPHPNQNG